MKKLVRKIQFQINYASHPKTDPFSPDFSCICGTFNYSFALSVTDIWQVTDIFIHRMTLLLIFNLKQGKKLYECKVRCY